MSKSARCDCRNDHYSSSGRCNVRNVTDPTRPPGQVAICEDCRQECPAGAGDPDAALDACDGDIELVEPETIPQQVKRETKELFQIGGE